MYAAPWPYWGVLAGALLTLGACLLWRRRPGHIWAGFGLSLLLALGPLSLVWFTATANGDGAVYIVMFGAPVLALLALAVGAPLARAWVTRHWGKALAIAAVSLVGHVLTGWPLNFAPEYVHIVSYKVQQARDLATAAHQAQPLLKVYGLRLPPGCRVLHTIIAPQSAGAFMYPQARLQLSFPRDWSAPQQEMRRQLAAQGFHELRNNSAPSFSNTMLFKEYCVLDVIEGQQQYGRATVELLLARDPGGKFLSRWIPGWQPPSS
jgi:hypothetical protein